MDSLCWDKINYRAEYRPKNFGLPRGSVCLIVGKYKGKWSLFRYVKVIDPSGETDFGYGWKKFKTLRDAQAWAGAMVAEKRITID